MNITKEQLFQTIDEDKLIWIKHVYLPYIGKTEFRSHDEVLKLSTENAILESKLQPLNKHRKDENGVRFDIDNVFVKIDFHNMKIDGQFQKVWSGGLVETFHFEYDITSIVGKELFPPALQLEITADLGN